MRQSTDFTLAEQWILNHVSIQETVMTPSDLYRDAQIHTGLDRGSIRLLTQKLVSEGQLEYTDIYGRTCLSVSFSRPMRLSSRVVVKPPDIPFISKSSDVVVSLNKGIAFGRGTHPTTRLSILALTYVYDHLQKNNGEIRRSLDIGTGTGVLAIVSAMLGTEDVLGCDIDCNAIDEAEKNVRLNGMESIVRISDSMDHWDNCDLIIANLRYPTLISLCPILYKRLSDDGRIVLSGIKTDEKDHIVNCYEQGSHSLVWDQCAGEWWGLVFESKKTDCK